MGCAFLTTQIVSPSGGDNVYTYIHAYNRQQQQEEARKTSLTLAFKAQETLSAYLDFIIIFKNNFVQIVMILNIFLFVTCKVRKNFICCVEYSGSCKWKRSFSKGIRPMGLNSYLMIDEIARIKRCATNYQIFLLHILLKAIISILHSPIQNCFNKIPRQ